MSNNISQRAVRHLAAAEGYLELGMPKHAMEELERLEDAGPLEAPRQFLTGQALKALRRYDDAVEPLRLAAERLPAHISKLAWLSLSECYRKSGHLELAYQAASTAEAIGRADRQVSSIATLTLKPHLHVEIRIHPC